MFTGIIEELGTVRRREGGELVIGCSTILEDSRLGDSIAVNGVSLTVATLGADCFGLWIIPHTLQETNLGDLRSGSPVNLEYDMLAKYAEKQIAAR